MQIAKVRLAAVTVGGSTYLTNGSKILAKCEPSDVFLCGPRAAVGSVQRAISKREKAQEELDKLETERAWRSVMRALANSINASWSNVTAKDDVWIRKLSSLAKSLNQVRKPVSVKTKKKYETWAKRLQFASGQINAAWTRQTRSDWQIWATHLAGNMKKRDWRKNEGMDSKGKAAYATAGRAG